MSFLKWLLAGAVGAAVGGVAWVLIGHFANSEVGWIAWGIGFLAGAAVRLAAGNTHGAGPGLAAVTAAGAGIAAAKYAVVWLAVNEAVAQLPAFATEEVAIIRTADEIITTDYIAQNKPVPWPAGVTFEEANSEADYPPAIWAEAKQRWAALPDAEKQARRGRWKAEFDATMTAAKGAMRSDVFAQSFTPYDLLWFGLAMFTAFRVGSGSPTESAAPKPAEAPEESEPRKE